MSTITPWEELRNKGLELLKEKQFKEAVSCFQQAADKAKEVEDGRMTCVILGELALALAGWGKFREALAVNEQALLLAQQGKLTYSEAALLANIGCNHKDQGMLETAVSYYERALVLFEGLGNKNGQAKTLGYYGTVAALLGRKQKAIDCFIRSLSFFHEAGVEASEKMLISTLLGLHDLPAPAPDARFEDEGCPW